jgi:hypothetical protein
LAKDTRRYFGKRSLRYFAGAGISASFLQNANGKYAVLRSNDMDNTTQTVIKNADLRDKKEVTRSLLQANASIGVKWWNYA